MAVGLVEQPYRAAGRRPPSPAPQLDMAFLAVVAAARKALSRRGLSGIPVILGGRSSGGRVACRTARIAGASGVLALAFPLQPPLAAIRGRAAQPVTGIARRGSPRSGRSGRARSLRLRRRSRAGARPGGLGKRGGRHRPHRSRGRSLTPQGNRRPKDQRLAGAVLTMRSCRPALALEAVKPLDRPPSPTLT